MKREVLIDNVRVDIDEESAEGYIFKSPIFTDLGEVKGNWSTTYRLPKSANNLKLIGLANFPDVEDQNFPFEKHVIQEWRNGLLFFEGICYLLEVNEKYLEFSVTWGSNISFEDLKDINLRELDSNEIIPWGTASQFMLQSDESGFGFLRVDFGQGFGDMQYVHPSVNIAKIKSLIENQINGTIEIPERLTDVFNKTWIPLLEKNTGQPNWDEYTVEASGSIWDYYTRWNALKLTAVSDNPYNIIDSSGQIHWNISSCEAVVKYNIKIKPTVPEYENGVLKRVAVGIAVADENNVFSRIRDYDIIEADEDGWYRHTYEIEYNNRDLSNPYFEIVPVFAYMSNSGIASKIETETVFFDLAVTIKEDVLRFGEKFPLVANLPDLSVTDFLKAIMQMYGLFAFYDRNDKNRVILRSMEDIYENKDKAYDWTMKLLRTSDMQQKGFFSTTYKFKDYAQINHCKYDNDEDVKVNADGVILVEATTIKEKEKDLFVLPFSASDNTGDDLGNSYAFIPLYKNTTNGIEYQDLKYRVLRENRYTIDQILFYKSGTFHKSLYFSGNEGLLNTYYSQYMWIIRKPRVIELAAEFTTMDLCMYNETYPVFNKGIYYSMIELTVTTSGVGRAKLIKMPPNPPKQ